MSVSLMGCKFEHTELPIHFESFNGECAIVKETQDANLSSQESKLTRANFQLNWCPSCLERILTFSWFAFSQYRFTVRLK